MAPPPVRPERSRGTGHERSARCLDVARHERSGRAQRLNSLNIRRGPPPPPARPEQSRGTCHERSAMCLDVARHERRRCAQRLNILNIRRSPLPPPVRPERRRGTGHERIATCLDVARHERRRCAQHLNFLNIRPAPVGTAQRNRPPSGRPRTAPPPHAGTRHGRSLPPARSPQPPPRRCRPGSR